MRHKQVPMLRMLLRKVGADVEALTNYLTKGGVPADALTLGRSFNLWQPGIQQRKLHRTHS
jgi:hypothetical protein